MTFDIRPGSTTDHRALADTVSKALLFPPRDDEGWVQSAPSWEESANFGAWDGAVCVGSVSQYDVDTTVPGGERLPTGAVSRVGVLPTHRRRGVATALMHRLIDDAAERGLALMSLRASEAVIYERYGFGLAGEFQRMTIAAARARPVRGATAGGSFRYLDRAHVLAAVQPIYDRAMHRRAGTVTRPPSWWRRYFADAIKQATSSYVVVHVDEHGVADGYLHYDVAWNKDPGQHGGKGIVHEVIAIDDAIELALWGFVLDMDLVRTWKCAERPVDDLLRWAIHDRRAYAVDDVDDEQWLRLIDVDRALRARSYGPAPAAVTVEVTDPRLAANEGVWRVDSNGASRSDATPQLRAGIAALSAAYLGGTAWRALAATGRVEVYEDGAVERADALFAVRPLPFCGSFF
jgi:predicted acetyltransferase